MIIFIVYLFVSVIVLNKDFLGFSSFEFKPLFINFIINAIIYIMKEVSIKDSFDKFKPESCVFVISIDIEGKPSGMVAGWNMKCSFDPPLFAVSLQKEGHTHKLIQESKEFVIAVPNKDLLKELEFFGSTHGDEVDKFKETKIETEKAKFVKSPLIKNATINFECALEKEVDSGDHIIFVGKILTSYVNRDKKVLFNMKKVKGKRIFQEL